MAVTTPDAVPGEVIEAAWGDAVRADLLAHDSAIASKVNRAGDASIGDLLIGKASAGIHLTGVELLSWGGSSFSWGASGGSVGFNHQGASDANGQQFQGFYRFTSPLGSITQVNASGVAYNTTSDKRIKTLTRPVNPDEAVDKVAALEPVNFIFTADPGAGEQIGFFAQDLYPVAPEVVTSGTGEPGDEYDPNVPGSGFVPWMVDVSKLVPTLVAAVQALTRRIELLEQGATV